MLTEVQWNTSFWLAKQMLQHLQVVWTWKNVSSSRPLRMYFTVMFKMLQWLFSEYFRNLIQLKRNELYIGLHWIFITLLLPQGKISFPTSFFFFFLNRIATTTHCYPTPVPFSPVPAVSNHLPPPAGPGPVVTRLVPVSKQTGEIPGPEAEAVSMGTIENLFISFLWKIAGFPVLGVLPDHTSFPVLILASPSM